MNRIGFPIVIIIFILLLAVIMVFVVLIGTTNLGSVITNIIEPAELVGISDFADLPSAKRIQVEGYFHNRDEWWLFGHEYDCDNYFLSENEKEPYGDIIELCINLYDTDDAFINAFDGHRVLIVGRVHVVEGNSRIEKYLSFYQNEDIKAVP